MLKFERLWSSARPDGPRFSGQAAMILTPGAIISGFRTEGMVRLGPREEKRATEGARDLPVVAEAAKRSRALGILVEFMKDFSSRDWAKPMIVEGRTWASRESSC